MTTRTDTPSATDAAALPLVTLILGEAGRGVTLPARPVALDAGALTLRLPVLPFRLDWLAPGALLTVRDQVGAERRVVVRDFAAGPLAVLVVAPPAEPAATNRRVHPRVLPFVQQATLARAGGGTAARFSIRLLDLSDGGARLHTPRALTDDDLLALQLPPAVGAAHPLPLEVRARLAWSRAVERGWQAGLRFVE